MQTGWGAWDDIIHVAAQPVTPSDGITEETGTLPSATRTDWFTGHAVPITMSPFSNPSISSVYTAQYLLIIGFCCFSSVIAASNCGCVSSYGSVMFRSGWCAFRYIAASAM